jgi:hypothetical protein
MGWLIRRLERRRQEDERRSGEKADDQKNESRAEKKCRLIDILLRTLFHRGSVIHAGILLHAGVKWRS